MESSQLYDKEKYNFLQGLKKIKKPKENKKKVIY